MRTWRLDAIRHRKHLVLMNAELDATIGPLLKVYADRAGIVITNADGDQPGVIMNLYRFVQSIGFTPVLAGNIKGLQDPYRTPETQRAFAEKYHQKPRMVTSFADGTKISMEMAVVANATGHRAGRRGMYGPRCEHVKDALTLFPMDQLLDGGWSITSWGGTQPGCVRARVQRAPDSAPLYDVPQDGRRPVLRVLHALSPVQLRGPYYRGTSRAVSRRHDRAMRACVRGPDVAKRNLQAGEVSDGIGGFTCYGVLENREPFRRAPTCRWDCPKVAASSKISRRTSRSHTRDVEVPAGRLVDALRAEQDRTFPVEEERRGRQHSVGTSGGACSRPIKLIASP